MMKLGKAIIKTDSSFVKVELSDFNIASMTWSKPRIVNLKLEDESFATGGFRIAYKAKSQPDDDKLYVLKKYTSESLKNLQRLEETPHAHARKSVQLNALASNFAKQLCSELESEDYIKLSYNNLSYGTILETKEVITLEPFIDGQFLKHVNNDGTVYARSLRSLGKFRISHVMQRVCVSHDDDGRCVIGFAKFRRHLQYGSQCRARFACANAGVLNDNAVCHGVRKGNA